MYLLDTNVVSELRKRRPHGAVVAWVESVHDADLHLSVVTLAEIQAGVEITRRQDSDKAAEIERWLEALSITMNVIPMDGVAFRLWARIMHGRSAAPYEDAMIAATARVHRLTVVTRNVGDFAPFDVPLLDPWKYRSR